MMNNDNVNRNHNITKLVGVNEGQPPEELLAQVSGNCGRWQVSICVVAFIAEFMHGCNLFILFVVAPKYLNYSCADGNGSKCWDTKGKKCKNFTFFKENIITTFTEKFLLVCENEWKIIWIENSFHIGVILSYLIVGWTSDKCGRKISAMIFVPLHTLSGVLIVTSSDYGMLLCFFFLHGIFSATINLLPKVTVCETVANEWRTLALGLIVCPIHLSWMIVLCLPIIDNTNAIIMTFSFLPLALLVPLLYFKNSAVDILHRADFIKTEKALRQIGRYNGRPLKDGIRIRPLETFNLKVPDRSCAALWNSSAQTKKTFLALLGLWFILGIYFNIILYYLFVNVTNTTNLITLGLTSLVAAIFSICLCHAFQHKLLICIFSILQNISILTIYLLIQFLEIYVKIMGVVTLCFFWIYATAMDNITPRMWPTCLRSRGLGMGLGLFHSGCVFVNIVVNSTRETLTWLVAATLIILLVAEVILPFQLWNVHNRELPDFVDDVVNFKRFYKPRRYIFIDEDHTTTQEIEIKHVVLN